jgi:hypothetical protein
VERFVRVIPVSVEVLLIPAEEAEGHLFSLISGKQILVLAVVPVEGTVTPHALHCGSWIEASVTSVGLLLQQILNGSINIQPLLSSFIIPHIVIGFKTFLMEVEILRVFPLLRLKNLHLVSLLGERPNKLVPIRCLLTEMAFSMCNVTLIGPQFIDLLSLICLQSSHATFFDDHCPLFALTTSLRKIFVSHMVLVN